MRTQLFLIMSLLIMGMCLDPNCISAKPLKEKNTVASAKGLPSTYADFKERCHTVAVTPEGAVKMYFDAVFCYFDPSRRTEASKMLRYIMHADANWDKKTEVCDICTSPEGSRLPLHIQKFCFGNESSKRLPHVARELFAGLFRLVE